MTRSEALAAKARSYEEAVRHGRSVAASLNSATQQRLVWFVGIAGYVLLNGQSFSESLLGQRPPPGLLFLLAVPWVAAAIAAIITHRLIEGLELADARYQGAVVSSLQMFQISVLSGQPVQIQFEDVLFDHVPEQAALKADSASWNKRVRGAEKSTHVLLGIGFLSALLGPIAGRCLL